VVLLHGLASTFEHNWREPGWFDLLTEAGRDVLDIDLPGHGRVRTGDGPHATDPAAYADVPGEVARRITAATADPVDAVGFSLGGHTLLTIAAAQPERFRRLAILGVGDSALRPPTGSHVLADAFTGALAAGTEPEPGVAQLFWRLARTAGNDPAVLAAFLRRPFRSVEAADIARITCPVLVVIGDRDQGGPADELVAALPNASLVVLRGTDHFATTMDYRCMDAVLGFLAD
jgi:pimeloyl-ACP methyl ester carboxylesterase